MGAKERELYKVNITDLFNKGVNLSKIAIKLDINRLAVKKVLIAQGVYAETRKYIKDDTEAQKKIISLYKDQNLSLKEIATLVDYDLSTITNFVRSSNVKMKNAGYYNRKYSCNEKAFIKYTPESCYWAGFIAGDGCVYNHGLADKTINNCLNVGLSIVDEEHLVKLKNYLEYDGKIYKGENKVALNVNSKNLVKYLEYNFGITNNKTETYCPPSNIPNELIKYFILGLMDSDGCISKIKRPNTNSVHIKGLYVYQISFTGTKESCEFIKTYFNSKVKLTKRHNNKVNNYSFNIQGNLQIKRILGGLYDNQSRIFCLSRKLDKFDDLILQYQI